MDVRPRPRAPSPADDAARTARTGESELVQDVPPAPHAPDEPRLVARSRGQPASCGYCRAELRAGDALLVCEGCAAVYHSACLRRELGRCGTLGCSATRALPRRHNGWSEVARRERAAADRWAASVDVWAGCGSLVLAAAQVPLAMFHYWRAGWNAPVEDAAPFVLTFVALLWLAGRGFADAPKAPPPPPPSQGER